MTFRIFICTKIVLTLYYLSRLARSSGELPPFPDSLDDYNHLYPTDLQRSNSHTDSAHGRGYPYFTENAMPVYNVPELESHDEDLSFLDCFDLDKHRNSFFYPGNEMYQSASIAHEQPTWQSPDIAATSFSFGQSSSDHGGNSEQLVEDPAQWHTTADAFLQDPNDDNKINEQTNEYDDIQHDYPRLPALKWQTRLFRSEVDKIFARLSFNWPRDLPALFIEKHLYRVSRWLDANPKVVKALLRNDAKFWEKAIKKCMPNIDRPTHYEKEVEKHKNTRMVHPAWLAMPIISTEKDFIEQRLSNHWNGAYIRLVQCRLSEYTELTGKIQSPEPLLQPDEMLFRKAADAIFCESAPRGQRHVGASSRDLLHRYSKKYSLGPPNEDGSAMYVPRQEYRILMGSKRYKSGESWMEGMPIGEIAKVQRAIRVHWVDRISDAILTPAYLRINEYLEHNKEDIHKIQAGDTFTAWNIARQMLKPRYLKQKEYSPIHTSTQDTLYDFYQLSEQH